MGKLHFVKLGVIQLVVIGIVFAQEYGTLRGRIIDRSTGDPLPGANIVVVNTSLGVASDYNGEFTLHYIPVGKQTVKISYIGYEQIISEVSIEKGGILYRDFSLVPQVIMGEEVVVTAQVRGQQAAINQQLTANTIKNVVAAERIRELPDASASAALSRLPGISIQEGDKITIRGIQAKQNVILMNGIQLPSTDMEDRSVNLGFISSNMLSGIEVIKVLTPDMDANTLGGVVNLRLMEAPDDFHVDVLTQGMYNMQDQTRDNYKAWLSVSNRFFDGKLGIYMQGHIDRTNAGSDYTNANYQIDNDEVPFGQGVYRMNTFAFTDQEHIVTNRGGSIVLDYVFPQGKVILQNSISKNVNDFADYRTELNFSQTLGTYSIFRDKHNRELLINSLFSEFNLGTFKVELNLSHSYSNKNTELRYGDPGQQFGFVDNYVFGIIGYTPSGVPIAKTFTAERDYFTPDDVYRIVLDDSSIYRAKLSNWAVMREEDFNQHLYTAKLDITIPVPLPLDFTADVKVGTKFDRTVRKNDVEGAYHRVGDNDMYNGVQNLIARPSTRPLTPANPLMFNEVWDGFYKDRRGKYFLDGNYPIGYVVDKKLMDLFMPMARAGWNLSRHKANSERYDFTGIERFIAGYLMGILKIGPVLTLIGGSRYEQYEMDYKSTFVFVTHSVDGLANLYDTLNTVKRVDRNWFPNAQLLLKGTEWSTLRLAYSKGISRPDYLAIIPNVYYAPQEQTQVGNPTLKPTTVTNYDASLSVFSNAIGMVTLAGFYKKLQNVFFQTQIFHQNLRYYNVPFPDTATFRALGITDFLEPGEKVTVFINNPHPGYVRGYEIEWQSNFVSLPSPLNLMVINANYTRTWSTMEYLRIENIDSTWREGRFIRHKYITRSKTLKGRLLYQGDHILNVAFGIDYKGFSGRISYNLQDAVTSYVGNRPEEDQTTGQIYRWDVTLKQELPIPGLSVAFNGVNIFRSAEKTYQKFIRPGSTRIISNLVRTLYSPSFYELMVRYSL
ncbi:MAG: TonB-dependent receptor [Bacteroidetes bacterium]|nr:TonB-dependent receptor [Bacteroidota bacterium]